MTIIIIIIIIIFLVAIPSILLVYTEHSVFVKPGLFVLCLLRLDIGTISKFTLLFQSIGRANPNLPCKPCSTLLHSDWYFSFNNIL